MKKLPVYAVTAFGVGFTNGNSIIFLNDRRYEADDFMVSNSNPPTFVPYRVIDTPISSVAL